MRRALAFSFITLGVSSLISQVLLIRELMIVFYGNEFFIGWTLFSWLFWVGAGSLLATRWIRDTGDSARPLEPRTPCAAATGQPPDGDTAHGVRGSTARGLIACHVLIALALPLELFLLRASRFVVGAIPGEIPNLLPSLGYAFLALAPFCLVLGIQFVVGARTWNSETPGSGAGLVLSRAYLYETVGFVVGGLVFGFSLVTANEVRVAVLTAWLNVIAGSALYARPQNRSMVIRLILIAVSSVAAIGYFVAGPLNLATSRWRFPKQELVKTRNSIYGNIAVTRLGDQNNFFENGLFLAPDQDPLANEQLVHFPLLYHPAPRRVLLVGGGFNGALAEIFKHGVERVDYVELDPQLIQTARPFLSRPIEALLNDPRVSLAATDGRYFLKQLPKDAAYDVILVSMPNPSTALINRFFTREFLREARSHLAPDGILATRLAFAPDYLSPELENLGASLYRTLQQTFGALVILPEYTLFFIASPDGTLHYDAAILTQRFDERKLKTSFVTKKYIEYRLTTDRIQQVQQAFDADRAAGINRDERPIAYFYNLVYWVSSFQPRVARWAAVLERPWVSWAVVAAALILLVANRRRIVPGAMAVGSFSLMACEVLIIFSFQVFYGYLYYKIALIIAALMLGMAAGTALGARRIGSVSPRTLARLHGLILLYALAFIAVSRLLSEFGLRPSGWIEALFLAAATLIGGLVGFEFPVANRLYLAGSGDEHRKTGVIYAVDLFGSCLGAAAVSLVALPVLGVTQTLLMLVVLNATVIVALAASPTPSR